MLEIPMIQEQPLGQNSLQAVNNRKKQSVLSSDSMESMNRVTNRAKQAPQGQLLRKGQKVSLCGSGSIEKIKVTIGWEAQHGYDLDASAFILGQNGKVISDDWFVFYGQLNSPDMAVRHSGETGKQGNSGVEHIVADLSRLNPAANKIVFILTINNALMNGQNFAGVRNAYMTVANETSNIEMFRFNLSEYYSNVTQMMIGEVYKHNGQWKLNLIGDGVQADLAGLCARYGVNVE